MNTIALKTAFLVLALALSCAPAIAKTKDVSLVLQLTVDQLRGDLPLRFEKRFGKGGFRRFLDEGAYYTNAHYIHADTETAPGHATLATGGAPAQHGITNSEWWDYKLGKTVYAVEDGRYPILDKDAVSTSGTSSLEKGRSPENLLSTTIGDEIVLASGGKALAIAISGKDRAAILPGGKCGQAYWLSRGLFINSTFYNKQLPDWVREWNESGHADAYKARSWTLLQDRGLYERLDIDKRSYEGFYKHLGGTLPKKYAAATDLDFYNGLLRSPVGDELVLSFARQAIKSLALGKRGVTDYLSVSFSSTDYVGHLWGVGSLEAEDNLMRVDRNLASLLDYVDRELGLNKVLVVLSADHGVSEIAESLLERGIPAGRIPTREFKKFVNRRLSDKYKVKGSLLKSVTYPYIYLDVDAIKAEGLSLEEVEDECAGAAMEYPGILYAVGRSRILKGENLNNKPYSSRIVNNFHPRRSGHVHVVTDQYYMFGKHKTTEPGEHGSVWSYDTYVPVAFLGARVESGRFSRLIGPQDIAPTLANYLGIKPPSGCIGSVLREVVGDKTKAK